MKLPPMRTSGIFGLARGQIARINAVHIGDPGIKPIELTMQFINPSGETVAQNTKTVHPMPSLSTTNSMPPWRETGRSFECLSAAGVRPILTSILG
jgi:hypothetical protein